MSRMNEHSPIPLRATAGLLLLSLAGSFALLRAWLWLNPDADVTLGGYNIHHLYTGLLLILGGGVPLALLGRDGPGRRLALVVFGSGLAMALDEWVYLIATDGSNAAYLLPVSFWGGVAMIGLACAYVLLAAWHIARGRRRDGGSA